MSSITSAGVASGIDFESIIKASVEAKKQQMNSKLTTNKQNSKLELTGVGLLKSNLSKDLLGVDIKNCFF
jgi:flagellar hook-associated protein 2